MSSNVSLYAQLIRERLPLREALESYGLTFNRSGFASCPFHGPERTGSFKVYGQHYKCFGCGEYGDLLDYVQHTFGLTPLAATKKLDDDFALGLPLEAPQSPQEALAGLMQANALRRRQAAKRAKLAALQAAYESAYRLWLFWDYLVWLYTPANPNDITDAYANALWMLPIADEDLTLAADALRNFNERDGYERTFR